VRILLDVLNATTQLVQTQRDLKRARYDFLLSGLRLKASGGTLGEDDISAVSGLLDAAQPIEIPEVPGANIVPQRPVAPPIPPATTPSPPAPTDKPAGAAPSSKAKPVKKPRR
jgi:outer membrane protein